MASLEIHGHGKSNDLELSLGADVMPSALEAGALSLPVTGHYTRQFAIITSKPHVAINTKHVDYSTRMRDSIVQSSVLLARAISRESASVWHHLEQQ